MNCFNHPDKPAVGLCKNCYKGLCAECAAALPDGLACADTCRGKVASLNEMTDQAAASGAWLRRIGWFLFASGILLCCIDGAVKWMGTVLLGLVFVRLGGTKLFKRERRPSAGK